MKAQAPTGEDKYASDIHPRREFGNIFRPVVRLYRPLIFGLMVFIFAFEGGAISRLLLTRPMQRLGAWSYSIYLLHLLLIFCVRGVLHFPSYYFPVGVLQEVPARYISGTVVLVLGSKTLTELTAVLYLALVIGLSSQTYYFVEMPAWRFFKGLATHVPGTKPGVPGFPPPD